METPTAQTLRAETAETLERTSYVDAGLGLMTLLQVPQGTHGSACPAAVLMNSVETTNASMQRHDKMFTGFMRDLSIGGNRLEHRQPLSKDTDQTRHDERISCSSSQHTQPCNWEVSCCCGHLIV